MTRSEFLEDRYCGDCEVDCQGVSGETAGGGAYDPERGGGGDCEGSRARQRTGAPVTPSAVGVGTVRGLKRDSGRGRL